MPPVFVDELPVSEEERQKILALGDATPMALLARRKANRRAFDNYLGSALADRIAPCLYGMLSEAEKSRLDEPSDFRPRFGARLD